MTDGEIVRKEEGNMEGRNRDKSERQASSRLRVAASLSSLIFRSAVPNRTVLSSSSGWFFATLFFFRQIYCHCCRGALYYRCHKQPRSCQTRLLFHAHDTDGEREEGELSFTAGIFSGARSPVDCVCVDDNNMGS